MNIKFFALLTIFLAGSAAVNGQQKTVRSYNDSIRRFMGDVVHLDPYYRHGSKIVTDATFTQVECEFEKTFSSARHSISRRQPGRRSRYETLLLTPDEVRYISSKIYDPVTPYWDSTFFPQERLITHSFADSFFQAFLILGKELNDSLAKDNYDNNRISSYAVYNKYEAFKKQPFWENGYLRLSNPVFIRNGRYICIFYWHYWGNTFINYHFSVYEKGNNRWEFFGYLLRGEIN